MPGLKLVMPSTPHDAKGLLKASIRDNSPVIFIENELLYGISGEVPKDDYVLPLGEADIKVVGGDVTIVASSRMANMVQTGLAEFEKEGISIELVDPRTVKPLDMETIARSVRKTHRAVIVEEGHGFAGIGAEFASQIYTACFDDLDAPVARVHQSENPLPYAKALEAASLPTLENVVRAAKTVLYRN